MTYIAYDADDMHSILQNIDESLYRKIDRVVKDALDKEGFNRDDPSDNYEPHDYYAAIGNAVREYITETGVMALIDVRSEIDWATVGEYYYDDASS